MKVLYLYNPNAGNNSNAWLREVEKYARENGIELETANVFEQVKLDNSYDKVIIAGGDGTVNCFINEALKSNFNTPIAILPAGTANDYATHLGMPRTMRNAIKTAFTGKIKPVDIGKANDKYFINICGVGNFMESNSGYNRDTKKALGKLAYYVEGFFKTFRMKTSKVTIKTDKKIYRGKFNFIAVMLGKSAGSFANLAPDAENDDGLFDIIALRKLRIREFPHMILKVIFRTHIKDKRVLHFKTKNLQILTKSKNPKFSICNLDGEAGPSLPLSIKILPKRLKFVHR